MAKAFKAAVTAAFVVFIAAGAVVGFGLGGATF